ncbi:MAG: cell division protein FtsZ [Flavobacteriales bacterium]|jgi:cell division protein FtsZ
MSDLGQGGISFDLPKNQSSEIKVIGVGGGGSNAVNYMFEQGIKGVDFVVCNTDAQALQDSPIPNKIQLGITLTEGLGAGANPEIGEKSAMESLEEVKNLLSTNTKMVFITAGMGGGTGTGAAPIIARTAREMGVLTVGIVTFPFSFEGMARKRQAEEGVEALRATVDSLIVVNNDKLRDVYGNLGFKSGFVKANEVLSTAAKGIAEVITQHYRMNIDLNDARTVLANSGTAIMGSASASGDSRAIEAVSKALDSPLLNDNDIRGCRSVLLLIISGEKEITLDEIGEVTDYVQQEAGGLADVIMGVGEDETLGDSICVTVIATGFDADQQDNIMPGEPTKIIHRLDSEDLAPKVTMNVEPAKVVVPAPRTTRPTSTAKAPAEVVRQEPKPEPVRHNLFDDEPVAQAIQYVNENQATLSFDMPLLQEEAEVEVEEMEEFSKPGVVYHKLVEEDLTVTESPNALDEVEEEEIVFELRTEEVEEVAEAPKEDWARPVVQQDIVRAERKLAEKPTVTNAPIEEFSVAEEQLRRARERKSRLKSFNYNFRNASSISNAESVPAYKRMGIDLEKTSHSSEQTVSRYTLGEDEQKNPQIRPNNSFLHDNVD